MNKKLIIILLFILSPIILVACNAQIDDIDFYLNPGLDTVNLNSEYEDPGVTAKVFGIKRATEVLENTVDTTKEGTYYIIYKFDYKDFYFELTRIVIVIDETSPVLSLNPGVDTIKVGQTWIDSGVEVSDNGEDDYTITLSGSVNTAVAGSYTITYSATDSSGNTSVLTRIVNVIE
ncbi:MAG: DUF5011 domain-containing protein [Acholeplasma sp.]|nr:DUF5011 domain-containing protein [Acholeplasma sp.]